MAQSAATTQTVEAYVGETMDNAPMGRIHWQVLALVASGYFFDVLDFTIFGALVPDLIKSGFVTQAQVPWIGSVTVAGLFVGTLGQGEFTDRFGRKAVYQFNLLLFGLATIVAALPPIPPMPCSLPSICCSTSSFSLPVSLSVTSRGARSRNFGSMYLAHRSSGSRMCPSASMTL